MVEEKAGFLRNDFIPLLRNLPADAPRKWGKLNLQGMIEHLGDSLRMANGHDLFDCDATEAHLEKMHEFIRSEKPFRENTVSPRLPAEPLPLRWETRKEALEELEGELAAFFDLFADDHERLVTHPVFGDLDYELWVRLLYKHITHHLRQFGAALPAE